jgi:PAS domain S-box-containing protein
VHDADDGEAQFVLAIIRDVTERKRAEEAVRQLNKDLENRVEERTSQLEATIAELESNQQELRHSEEIFRLLVEGVREYAIFMLGPDGRIVICNEGAERVQGYEVSEAVGEHFSVFYTEEDVDRGLPGEELRVAAIEGRFEEEGWRIRKDGTLFQADAVITALRDEVGDLRGFSQVTRDITARKEAEEALRNSLRKMADLKGRPGRIRGSRYHRRERQDHVCERQVLRDLQILHGGVVGPGSPHSQLRLPHQGVLREPVEYHHSG